MTTLHDLEHISTTLNNQDFINIKNFISTHTSNNNFKLINQPHDKLFIIPDKLIIELKIYENLYLAFIHFTYSNDTNFISFSLNCLNQIISHELKNTHNERLIKLFDKKIVLYSTFNSSFSHYYKAGPLSPTDKTIYNFSLPSQPDTNGTPMVWYEYTIRLNQFIYNNLSKDIQKQKHQEKKTMQELSGLAHSHQKSKIKPMSFTKRQKTSMEQ